MDEHTTVLLYKSMVHPHVNLQIQSGAHLS